MASVIFDFDGTLADSFPLILEAAQERRGGRQLSDQRVAELRQLPLPQALRALGLQAWRIPFVLLSVRRAMYARRREVPLFPGVPAAIRSLHAAGHHLFILSSNRPMTIQAFLHAHQLDEYFEGIYHCGIFRKGAGIRKLLRVNHLSAKHCWYVANEAADIEDVQAVGVNGVAVTWSGQDETVLSKALPARLVATPGQLEQALAEEVI